MSFISTLKQYNYKPLTELTNFLAETNNEYEIYTDWLGCKTLHIKNTAINFFINEKDNSVGDLSYYGKII